MSLGYLLASLPMLFLDRPPAMSVAKFCAACEGVLSQGDANEACALAKGLVTTGTYGRRWQAIDAAIANAIGHRRLAKRGMGGETYSAPESSVCPVWLLRGVDAAFESSGNPLEREEALMKVRWLAAEEMGGVDPMGRGQLFAYAVKLHLCTVKAARDVARGQARLEAALPKQLL